jgi:hypothetical protein
MTAEGLIHGQSFPPSMTLIAARLLLLIGIAAIANMVFHTSACSDDATTQLARHARARAATGR